MIRPERPRAIIDRKGLIRELEEQVSVTGFAATTRGNFLQIFKAALYGGVAEIRRRFEEEGIDGEQVVHADAFLVDQLVRTLAEFTFAHVVPVAPTARGSKLSIAATGGYGRGELSPFSDIDLMFLLPNTGDAAIEQVVESMLYTLWDMGLKVGHATRTVAECVDMARRDLTIRTSLLEARWLWGNKALYREFEVRFYRDVVAGTEAAFVTAKLAQRDVRHERMGDSRYVLEPNIKEGKGGLRDLQTLFWIAKYLYKVSDMDQLTERGVFTTADARHFRQTQEFLWTVRCHLHYVAGRPEERLTFDVQEKISQRLGYRSRNGARGVERFMKHYFLITKTVGDLTRVLCAVLEDEQRTKGRLLRLPSLSFSRFRRKPNGFKIVGGRLMVSSETAFSRDPIQLFRLFSEAQKSGLDIHPRALRLTTQSLRLIDQGLRVNPVANQLFLEMLTSEHDPETTLRHLNEAGVFGRFVPDFNRVVAQMQYDMYHVHTVDEHTIHAIGILSRMEKGKLKDKHPTVTQVVQEVRSRRALYVALLLHDIGKGRGGDHSEIGAQIALELCPRFGLDAWETETVSWLVRYHLAMSRVAFKRDIDDAKTVSDFVKLVQSPERLRMLLVLTSADIDAVGPGVWNSWKEGLLSELYYRALEHMEMTGGQPKERRLARVESAKTRLRERLADRAKTEVEAFVANGYADYWIAFDTESQAHHFDMVRRAERDELPLVVETRTVATRGVTELMVYAPDNAGLFARFAGAIALSAATIVDAKAITLANSMALDTFSIQDHRGEPYDEPDRLERLRSRIEAAVAGKLHPARQLEADRSRAMAGRTSVFRVPTAVMIDNTASRTHTVVEVNGRDRPGFLHDVASTLSDLGLQISSAHISTYGERVVDVFYVKDVFGLKIEDPSKLRRIQWKLREVVVPAEAPAAERVDVAAAE